MALTLVVLSAASCANQEVTPEDSGVPVDATSALDAAGLEDAGPASDTGDAGDAAEPDADPADAGEADTGAPDAEPEDASPTDTGPADAGPADAGTPCGMTGLECTGTEACVGEACSCVQKLEGAHYLRTDGTVVNWRASTVITTTTGVVVDRVTQIFSGSHHGCALRDDGAVWCWPVNSLGNNTGQLGRGNIVSNTPSTDFNQAQRVLTAADVGLADVVRINEGAARGYLASNGCGIRTDGTLWCWGSNDSSGGGGGDLFNDGVAGHRPYANAIMADAGNALTGVTVVSLGSRHACTIRTGATNGEVWCWGSGIGGACGQGNQNEQVYPVQVTLPAAADQVGAGANATCARVGGGVYCWGSSGSGQIGLGDWTDPANHDGCINFCRTTPAQVIDGTGAAIADVQNMTMFYLGACAVRANRQLWCWGRSTAVIVHPVATLAMISSSTVADVVDYTSNGSNGFSQTLFYQDTSAQLIRPNTTVSPVCP